MNTPDKCPQCGAEIMEVGAKGDWTAYLCESYIGVHAKDDFSQSNYCKERTAHAATRKELENYKADLDLAEMSVETLKQRAELAEARVRELEGLTQNQFAKRAADALAYACATTVKRGLIGSRSSIADALLDYLDVGGVGGPRDVCEWIDAYEKTLGEAMPRTNFATPSEPPACGKRDSTERNEDAKTEGVAMPRKEGV